MKTYDQLNEQQRERAHKRQLSRTLDWISQGNEVDVSDDVKSQIAAAWAEAERLQTPWFIGEIVMEKCGDYLRSLAIEDAKTCLYAEPDEYVEHGLFTET